MKILFGMPAKNSWGGPIASEPPFVNAMRTLGVEVTEEVYVYGDRERPTPVHRRICRVLTTALRFRKLLATQKFDLIHLNTAFDLRTIFRDSVSIFLMRPGRAKVFLKIHGSEAERFESANFIVRSLMAYIARRVDGFGVHTREERAAFVRIGFPEIKFHFVKNAVTIAEDRPSGFSRPVKSQKDTWDLLFVSRFIPVKGLIETIRACAVLRDNGVNFCLHCIGDGETRNEAEAVAASLGLSDLVKFTGYIPEQAVTEYFFESDILVFPTRHAEGFPNVLFKAVAAGLPVVTTKIRAAAEYLSEPENCLFCTQGPDDIASKLTRLINDNELRSKMSEGNLELGKTLEPRPIAEEFLAVYRDILKR